MLTKRYLNYNFDLMFKKNLTRKDLSNIIHKNLGFSKNISGNLINDVFDVIISGLKTENYVKISSFGTFKVLKKKNDWVAILKLKKKP